MSLWHLTVKHKGVGRPNCAVAAGRR